MKVGSCISVIGKEEYAIRIESTVSNNVPNIRRFRIISYPYRGKCKYNNCVGSVISINPYNLYVIKRTRRVFLFYTITL